jgi:phosphate:Na+ symporter
LIGSFPASGVIAPAGSLGLVLGANLGSALLPLFEAGSAASRRLRLGNLWVRAVGCVFVLPFLPQIAKAYRFLTFATSKLLICCLSVWSPSGHIGTADSAPEFTSARRRC